MAAAALSGFVVVWLILGYVRRHDFAPFVIYRLLAAAVVLTIIITGVRPAVL